MQTISEEIGNLFGGQVRVRACGICVQNEQVLLVRHEMYGVDEPFWSPPGGGIHFGETAEAAVKREFEEETGLQVEIGQLLFVNEHIQAPLHAIELFFEVSVSEGKLIKGSDPEMSEEGQIIREVRLISWAEIKSLRANQVHSIFSSVESLQDLFKIKGYISPR
ncbi:NUDIX domain-containing protein [Dyadobacter sp. CY343]|uniref:NUDIX domain-containing protein n=1 Tax=Dyadobacter sp. CY343 TaxID=2907299 RepID=UPI001F29069D|nr:NUDIX domain-containing protein [Dyadobacter sp. CY343]MCE7059941.1 NUDIX domain-containing protein [Dyadobacter sp. CY343]